MRVRSPALKRLTTSAALAPACAMRMSSGPSKRKEKPRSASSICIDDTPMSSTTPSTAATCSSRCENDACTSLSFPADDASSCAAGGDRIGIAVDRDDCGAARQDCSGVAARAEGGVDDRLSLGGRKRGKDFGKENRNVAGRSANRGRVPAVARHHSGRSPASSPAEASKAVPLPARHRCAAARAPTSGRNCRARQRQPPLKFPYARG